MQLLQAQSFEDQFKPWEEFNMKPQTTIDIKMRYRTFEVVFIGATNTKPSRFKIKDLRRNKSKTLSYKYEFNSVSDMAVSYLESIGIKIHALAMRDKDCLLLTEDFETNLK